MDDPTLTLELTPRELGWLDEAVASGAYPSRAAVLREALELWRAREEDALPDAAVLKKAYEAGIASGPSRVIDAMAFAEEVISRRAARS